LVKWNKRGATTISDMNYLIRLRGHQQGPFTADQLQKLATRGRFSRLYEVSTDGESWQRAERFPELFPPPPTPKARTIQPHVMAVAIDSNNASQPQTIAPEEAGPAEWYYTRGGEELGPVTAAQIKQLIGIGEIVADDYLWLEGMSNWQRVAELPEFAPALSPKTAFPLAAGSAPQPGAISSMAVASLVLGLLGFTIIGAILAIVFGHVAQAQIKQSQGALGGKGLALAGLILGYLWTVPAIIFGIVYVAILVLAPSGAKRPTAYHDSILSPPHITIVAS
jgi:hypothetical protein